jgi:hypothetical protein
MTRKQMTSRRIIRAPEDGGGKENLRVLWKRGMIRGGGRCHPEVRARMSAARKKQWADPEVRARMSAASKKALADPEVRARMSAARKKQWADPEVRARMSRRVQNRGNNLCEACAAENCLACDGGECRCICSLEMDVKRPARRRAAA